VVSPAVYVARFKPEYAAVVVRGGAYDPDDVQVMVWPMLASVPGVVPNCTLNVQAEGAVPDTVQYTVRYVITEFSNNAVLAAFVTGGKIAVPGDAGPPAPAANCDCSVSTAGEFSEHDGVEDDDSVHTDALSTTRVSAPVAPPLMPQYGRHPTTFPPVPLAIGAWMVTVEVDPVVVIVDVAAVSVDNGVSVLVDVKNVTPQRYVPAAMLPPVGDCENPVAVADENDCEFNNGGGATVIVSVHDCVSA